MERDEVLLERWRAGDEHAGNDLLRRHFKALLRFFRSKIDRGAEDLVQDTLLACVNGRDRLREGTAFKAYMFVVARRLLRDRLDERARGHPIDFTELSIADLVPGPCTIQARREEDRLILEALRRLPVDYQIALELHEWESMSGPDIAAILEVPEGTVRSRIRRARLMLHEHVAALAASPALLESTRTRLEDWAASIRELVERS